MGGNLLWSGFLPGHKNGHSRLTRRKRVVELRFSSPVIISDLEIDLQLHQAHHQQYRNSPNHAHNGASSSSSSHRRRFGAHQRNGAMHDEDMIEVDAYVKDLSSSTQPTFKRLSRSTLRCDLGMSPVDTGPSPERRGMRPANHFDLIHSEVRTDHLVLRGKFARLPLCARGRTVSLEALPSWTDVVDVAKKLSLPSLACLHSLDDECDTGAHAALSASACDARALSSASMTPRAEAETTNGEQLSRDSNDDVLMGDKDEGPATNGAGRRASMADDDIFIDPSATVEALLVHPHKPESFLLLEPLAIDYAANSLSNDDIAELEGLIDELDNAGPLSDNCSRTLDAALRILNMASEQDLCSEIDSSARFVIRFLFRFVSSRAHRSPDLRRLTELFPSRRCAEIFVQMGGLRILCEALCLCTPADPAVTANSLDDEQAKDGMCASQDPLSTWSSTERIDAAVALRALCAHECALCEIAVSSSASSPPRDYEFSLPETVANPGKRRSSYDLIMDALSNQYTFQTIAVELQAIVPRVDTYHKIKAFLQLVQTTTRFCAQSKEHLDSGTDASIPRVMAQSISQRIQQQLSAITACMLETSPASFQEKWTLRDFDLSSPVTSDTLLPLLPAIPDYVYQCLHTMDFLNSLASLIESSDVLGFTSDCRYALDEVHHFLTVLSSTDGGVSLLCSNVDALQRTLRALDPALWESELPAHTDPEEAPARDLANFGGSSPASIGEVLACLSGTERTSTGKIRSRVPLSRPTLSGTQVVSFLIRQLNAHALIQQAMLLMTSEPEAELGSSSDLSVQARNLGEDTAMQDVELGAVLQRTQTPEPRISSMKQELDAKRLSQALTALSLFGSTPHGNESIVYAVSHLSATTSLFIDTIMGAFSTSGSRAKTDELDELAEARSQAPLPPPVDVHAATANLSSIASSSPMLTSRSAAASSVSGESVAGGGARSTGDRTSTVGFDVASDVHSLYSNAQPTIMSSSSRSGRPRSLSDRLRTSEASSLQSIAQSCRTEHAWSCVSLFSSMLTTSADLVPHLTLSTALLDTDTCVELLAALDRATTSGRCIDRPGTDSTAFEAPAVKQIELQCDVSLLAACIQPIAFLAEFGVSPLVDQIFDFCHLSKTTKTTSKQTRSSSATLSPWSSLPKSTLANDVASAVPLFQTPTSSSFHSRNSVGTGTPQNEPPSSPAADRKPSRHGAAGARQRPEKLHVFSSHALASVRVALAVLHSFVEREHWSEREFASTSSVLCAGVGPVMRHLIERDFLSEFVAVVEPLCGLLLSDPFPGVSVGGLSSTSYREDCVSHCLSILSHLCGVFAKVVSALSAADVEVNVSSRLVMALLRVHQAVSSCPSGSDQLSLIKKHLSRNLTACFSVVIVSLETLNELISEKPAEERDGESAAMSQIQVASAEKIVNEFFNAFISTPPCSTAFLFSFRDVLRLVTPWLEMNRPKSDENDGKAIPDESVSRDMAKHEGLVELFRNPAFEVKMRNVLHHSLRAASANVSTAATEIMAHVMSISPESTWSMSETILDVISGEILKLRLPSHRNNRADSVTNASTPISSEPTLPTSPDDMQDETLSSPKIQQKSSVDKKGPSSLELLASPRPDLLCRALEVLRALISLSASRKITSARILEQGGLIRVLNDLGVCARLDVLISQSQLYADSSRVNDHVQVAQLLALDIVRHVLETAASAQDLQCAVDNLPPRSQLDIVLPVLVRLLAAPSPPRISQRIRSLANGLDGVHGTPGTPSSIAPSSSPAASPVAGSQTAHRGGNGLLRPMNHISLNSDSHLSNAKDAPSPSSSINPHMLDGDIPDDALGLSPPGKLPLTAHLLATRALYALAQNTHGASVLLEISLSLADQPWRSFLDFLAERLRVLESSLRDPDNSIVHDAHNGEGVRVQSENHTDGSELVEIIAYSVLILRVLCCAPPASANTAESPIASEQAHVTAVCRLVGWAPGTDSCRADSSEAHPLVFIRHFFSEDNELEIGSSRSHVPLPPQVQEELSALISTLESSNSDASADGVFRAANGVDDSGRRFPRRQCLDIPGGRVWSRQTVEHAAEHREDDNIHGTYLTWPVSPFSIHTVRNPLSSPARDFVEGNLSSIFEQWKATLPGLGSTPELMQIQNARTFALASASGKPSQTRTTDAKKSNLPGKYGGPRHSHPRKMVQGEPPRKKPRTHGSSGSFRAPRAYPMGRAPSTHVDAFTSTPGATNPVVGGGQR